MRSGSKTGLFLIELVLVILFFSISAAVCMRLFAAAKLATDYSRDIGAAASAAQNAAECFSASDGDLEAVAGLLGGRADKNEFTLDLDNALELRLIRTDEDSGAIRGTVSVYNENEPDETLFSISILVPQPNPA